MASKYPGVTKYAQMYGNGAPREELRMDETGGWHVVCR